jgi:hypothetical protein
VTDHPPPASGAAFADDLKAWVKAMGYTRDQAADELCVPKSTLYGWWAGRPPALEGSLRRLMALIREAGER